MQWFLEAVSLFCVQYEWRTRYKSGDTCPDIPIWLKNGVSSHSNIGHCSNTVSSRYLLNQSEFGIYWIQLKVGNCMKSANMKPVLFAQVSNFEHYIAIVTTK